jgi:hypothetical protein
MGALYTHSPKSPGTFPKLPKIHFLFLFLIQKNWDSPTGPGVDLRLAGNGRPQVGGPGPAGDQQLPAGRKLMPGPVGLFPFLLKFFFFLPSTFCASGQLFLIGCSTCLPCPNFSLKLQTSITFDP